MGIEFKCKSCGQLLSVEKEYGGRETECPKCNVELTIPLPGAEEGSRSCPRCGSTLEEDAILCVKCGFNLATGKVIQPPSERRLSSRGSAGAGKRRTFSVILKKFIVLCLIGAAGYSGYRLFLRLGAASSLRPAAWEFLADGKNEEALTKFEHLSSHGTAEDKFAYRQLLSSFGVEEKSGAFRIVELKIPDEVKNISELEAKTSSVSDLRFDVLECAWGQGDPQMSIQPSVAWIKFLFVNFGKTDIELKHLHFFLLGHGRRRRASSSFLQKEAKKGILLKEGEGVSGALFFKFFGLPPRYLEFNNTELLIRTPILEHFMVDDFSRDTRGLPKSVQALNLFPLRKSFSEQVLGKEEVEKYKAMKWQPPEAERQPKTKPFLAQVS